MAVYKIFPIQDTTLYSYYKDANTGLDPILELSKGVLDVAQTSTSRVLVKFSNTDVNSVMASVVGNYSASLKMYVADAVKIPGEYTVEVRPVAEDWVMGNGQFEDAPLNTSGASWSSKATGSAWAFPAGSTGSYQAGNVGGGSWWTSSVSTQSFSTYTRKDVDIDVTSIIRAHRSGSYDNNGILIKNATEFSPSEYYTLNYFSRDTHTIYPPCLEIKWDDSVYTLPSQSAICNSSDINVSVYTRTIKYEQDSVEKVRISARDKHPVRTFTTGSLYTDYKYLPSSSYWSLVDYKTKDVVTDFDEVFTKISADSEGNYFTLHTSGLEPARYYKILIKSVIGTESVMFDEDYIFKVE
jgi:hypothetical protein